MGTLTKRRSKTRIDPLLSGVLALLAIGPAARAEDLTRLLQAHAANKERLLGQLQEMPRLALTKTFGMDFRDVWRRVLIDGPCDEIDKEALLRAALKQTKTPAVRTAVEALLASHERLFDADGNKDLMLRHASDASFAPFGRHMTLAEALSAMTLGNDGEVQAFKTIFETGQNARGYVHKLECHGQVIEFIYAVTDIVYGVMLPSELDFRADKVTADPRKVRTFYIKAGEVIALHPYVLHSGSLSVEPNRSFSIVIYKQPVPESTRAAVPLPNAWQRGQSHLKLPGIDKFYLTLEELHTGDLKDNRGYITGKRAIRLPRWD